MLASWQGQTQLLPLSCNRSVLGIGEWQGTLGVRDDHCRVRVRVRRRVMYFFSSWNTRMTHIHSSSL